MFLQGFRNTAPAGVGYLTGENSSFTGMPRARAGGFPGGRPAYLDSGAGGFQTPGNFQSGNSSISTGPGAGNFHGTNFGGDGAVSSNNLPDLGIFFDKH